MIKNILCVRCEKKMDLLEDKFGKVMYSSSIGVNNDYDLCEKCFLQFLANFGLFLNNREVN